jgi:hypothetical protein
MLSDRVRGSDSQAKSSIVRYSPPDPGINLHSGRISTILVVQLSGAPLGKMVPFSISVPSDNATKSLELDAIAKYV